MTKITDITKLVFKNMFEKKGRVFLTITGIIIGIFTFTFFIFLSHGLENAVYEQFSSFGVNVLAVKPATSSNSGPPIGGGLTEKDIEKIKQVVKNYKYIAPAVFYSGLFEYGREKKVIVSIGYKENVIEKVFSDIGFEIKNGRLLRNSDKGVIIIGSKIASDVFTKEIRIGSSLKINGKSLRVVGILKDRGDIFVDNAIIMPYSDIKEISGQKTYSIIRVSFEDNVNLDEMEKAILRKLNPKNVEKRVEITSPKKAMEQFNQIIGVLSMIIAFISSIALLVGGVNVLNTMYSNVLERYNEISVMKALGATNKDILILFLIESLLLGLIGSIIGFLLAFGLAKFLSIIIISVGYNVPVYFRFDLFLEVIILTSIFAALFGTYPAYMAAKLNPTENLRDE